MWIGRFAHVSGIKFTFDPSLPQGSRVLSCKVGEEDVVPDKRYTLATRYENPPYQRGGQVY